MRTSFIRFIIKLAASITKHTLKQSIVYSIKEGHFIFQNQIDICKAGFLFN
jgi:hypothetical protein